MLTLARAVELLDRMQEKTILVIGDMMIDRYVCGSVERISPEAPVPVVRVTEESERPGGAANVALNIAALGGRATVCGIMGQDASADRLTGMLKSSGIRTDGLIRHADIGTTVKTRVIADRQQVVRVDRESAEERVQTAGGELVAGMPGLMESAAGVIIEDYGKGVVNQPLVDCVLAIVNDRPCGYDPKDNHRLAARGITLATPNFREACILAGLPERPFRGDEAGCATLREAAANLTARWNPEVLMITLGPHGLYLAPRSGVPDIIPTRAREVFDVSGAGDTVIAVALAALVAGADAREAAELANHAAGVVVAKLGTATCTREDLIRALREGCRNA